MGLRRVAAIGSAEEIHYGNEMMKAIAWFLTWMGGLFGLFTYDASHEFPVADFMIHHSIPDWAFGIVWMSIALGPVIVNMVHDA